MVNPQFGEPLYWEYVPYFRMVLPWVAVFQGLEWALSKLPSSSLRISVELETAAERWLGIMGTGIFIVSGSIFVSFVTNTMANVTRSTIRNTQVMGMDCNSMSKRRNGGEHGRCSGQLKILRPDVGGCLQ